MDWQDKVVVVTGGAGGIGHALAKRFAAEGARVVISDLSADTPTLRADPLPARFVAADMATEAGVIALIDDVLATEGRIDLYASNAGIALPMSGTSSDASWEKIMAINLYSHVWAARRLIPLMTQAGGRLLVTASAAGLLNEIASLGYGVTKHAAVGFAEWLAFTYADTAMRVSVLCPEGVRTPLIDAVPYLHKTAITPEALADAVLAGLAEGRFMLTTPPATLPAFQAKAADYEGYIARMADLSRMVRAAAR